MGQHKHEMTAYMVAAAAALLAVAAGRFQQLVVDWPSDTLASTHGRLHQLLVASFSSLLLVFCGGCLSSLVKWANATTNTSPAIPPAQAPLPIAPLALAHDAADAPPDTSTVSSPDSFTTHPSLNPSDISRLLGPGFTPRAHASMRDLMAAAVKVGALRTRPTYLEASRHKGTITVLWVCRQEEVASLHNVLPTSKYRILTTNNRRQLLEMLDSLPALPDVLLLDTEAFPGERHGEGEGEDPLGMQVEETLAAVRNMYSPAELPIITLGGEGSPREQMQLCTKALNALSSAYLPKPVDSSALDAHISAQVQLHQCNAMRGEVMTMLAMLGSTVPASLLSGCSRWNQTSPYLSQLLPEVTVLFVGIREFSSLVRQWSTGHTIAVLNELMNGFDDLVTKHGCHKADQTGGSYMVIAGHDGASDHAARIIRVAASMIAHANHACHGERLQISIGVHTGPAQCGVVGNAPPRFTVFGDIISTAMSLHSRAMPGCVLLSGATEQLLQRHHAAGTLDYASVGLGHQQLRNKTRLAVYIAKVGDWQAGLDSVTQRSRTPSPPSPKPVNHLFQPLQPPQHSQPPKRPYCRGSLDAPRHPDLPRAPSINRKHNGLLSPETPDARTEELRNLFFPESTVAFSELAAAIKSPSSTPVWNVPTARQQTSPDPRSPQPMDMPRAAAKAVLHQRARMARRLSLPVWHKIPQGGPPPSPAPQSPAAAAALAASIPHIPLRTTRRTSSMVFNPRNSSPPSPLGMSSMGAVELPSTPRPPSPKAEDLAATAQYASTGPYRACSPPLSQTPLSRQSSLAGANALHNPKPTCPRSAVQRSGSSREHDNQLSHPQSISSPQVQGLSRAEKEEPVGTPHPQLARSPPSWRRTDSQSFLNFAAAYPGLVAAHNASSSSGVTLPMSSDSSCYPQTWMLANERTSNQTSNLSTIMPTTLEELLMNQIVPATGQAMRGYESSPSGVGALGHDLSRPMHHMAILDQTDRFSRQDTTLSAEFEAASNNLFNGSMPFDPLMISSSSGDNGSNTMKMLKQCSGSQLVALHASLIASARQASSQGSAVALAQLSDAVMSVLNASTDRHAATGFGNRTESGQLRGGKHSLDIPSDQAGLMLVTDVDGSSRGTPVGTTMQYGGSRLVLASDSLNRRSPSPPLSADRAQSSAASSPAAAAVAPQQVKGLSFANVETLLKLLMDAVTSDQARVQAAAAAVGIGGPMGDTAVSTSNADPGAHAAAPLAMPPQASVSAPERPSVGGHAVSDAWDTPDADLAGRARSMMQLLQEGGQSIHTSAGQHIIASMTSLLVQGSNQGAKNIGTRDRMRRRASLLQMHNSMHSSNSMSFPLLGNPLLDTNSINLGAALRMAASTEDGGSPLDLDLSLDEQSAMLALATISDSRASLTGPPAAEVLRLLEALYSRGSISSRPHVIPPAVHPRHGNSFSGYQPSSLGGSCGPPPQHNGGSRLAEMTRGSVEGTSSPAAGVPSDWASLASQGSQSCALGEDFPAPGSINSGAVASGAGMGSQGWNPLRAKSSVDSSYSLVLGAPTGNLRGGSASNSVHSQANPPPPMRQPSNAFASNAAGSAPDSPRAGLAASRGNSQALASAALTARASQDNSNAHNSSNQKRDSSSLNSPLEALKARAKSMTAAMSKVSRWQADHSGAKTDHRVARDSVGGPSEAVEPEDLAPTPRVVELPNQRRLITFSSVKERSIAGNSSVRWAGGEGSVTSSGPDSAGSETVATASKRQVRARFSMPEEEMSQVGKGTAAASGLRGSAKPAKRQSSFKKIASGLRKVLGGHSSNDHNTQAQPGAS